jgi:hypothetical protein
MASALLAAEASSFHPPRTPPSSLSSSSLTADAALPKKSALDIVAYGIGPFAEQLLYRSRRVNKGGAKAVKLPASDPTSPLSAKPPVLFTPVVHPTLKTSSEVGPGWLSGAYQLSLLLLVVDDLRSLNPEGVIRVHFYDPVTTPFEAALLSSNAVGFEVLGNNDQGGWRVSAESPATLFYMPHCPRGLYSRVLRGNMLPDFERELEAERSGGEAAAAPAAVDGAPPLLPSFEGGCGAAASALASRLAATLGKVLVVGNSFDLYGESVISGGALAVADSAALTAAARRKREAERDEALARRRADARWLEGEWIHYVLGEPVFLEARGGEGEGGRGRKLTKEVALGVEEGLRSAGEDDEGGGKLRTAFADMAIISFGRGGEETGGEEELRAGIAAMYREWRMRRIKLGESADDIYKGNEVV